MARWWNVADHYGVLPLDDRNFAERAAKYSSAASPRLRTRLVLYPGMSRIPSGAAPLMINRSFRITARLSDAGGAPQGVVLSLGDLSGGFTLYVQAGRLCFEYNHEGTPYRIESCADAVTGENAHARVRVRAHGGLRGHWPALGGRQAGRRRQHPAQRALVHLLVGARRRTRLAVARQRGLPGRVRVHAERLAAGRDRARADAASRRSPAHGLMVGSPVSAWRWPASAPGADATLPFWRREPGPLLSRC